MKIIFINRYFYPDHSATSQFLTDLSTYLAVHKMNISVFTSRQIYDDPRAHLQAREIHHGIQIERIWSTRFGRNNLLGRTLDYISFYASAFCRVLFLIKSDDILVAKTDPPLISIVTAVACRLRNARQINWIQDLFPEVAKELQIKGINRFIFQVIRRVRNNSLHFASMNVTLSSDMKNLLVRQGISEERVTVIHNWADGSEIKPLDKSRNRLRQSWNLETSFIVGYSGNVGRAHEFGTILDAAELLMKETTIIFLFMGGGAQLTWIKEEISRRKLENICIKPYQPRDVLKYSLTLPDVHLVTLNSKLEGLLVPSKFYGALAAGIPVIYIGNSEGAIGRIIRKSKCGFAVDNGQHDILVEKIKFLASNQSNLREMGINARQLLEKNFEKNLALANWKRTLESLACNKS